ncbi:transporter suffix domain-containing protein [Maribellus sp. YY47]|uniref:transporter suffix domain-containing protein n=1 Tax=Maribellus sp. YY47 TaxID=2929486 RepID=UPI002000D72D|nr:transporter suffix domain-containing protein [Maribellus sp. YY47]MCK3685424.1 transporter suffix domain-containing protein [Maribellus sp. YY47]
MQFSKNKRIKLGIFLMVFSGVFFAATFVIPFLELSSQTKVIASATSLVIMEVVFWAGGLFVGKELFSTYKKQLDPRNWFIKKQTKDKAPEPPKTE